MRQWTVDAFAAAPFRGNPACVVEPFDQWPSADWMQALAKENNQAETAFLLRTADLMRVNRQIETEVAERRLTEQELRRTQADLVQAGKLAALGQMSAALSHEINQPLAAARNYADSAALLIDRGDTVRARDNIGQILSLQIALKERALAVEERIARRAIQVRLLGRMAGDEDFMAALGRDQKSLLDLTGATGAAIVHRGQCVLLGQTPGQTDVNALVDWLTRHHPAEDVFHTDALPAIWPEAAAFADLASGAGLSTLPRAATALVFCAAPDQRDETAYHALYVDGLSRLMATCEAPRIVFVSSTAVYGEHRGEWVDEVMPAAPVAFNGRVLRQAERWPEAIEQYRAYLELATDEGAAYGHLAECLAAMGARIEELLWLRCKCPIQEVTNLAAGIDCQRITGPAMRLQKPDKAVLMRPDIPVGSVEQSKALVWGVGTEVAIRFHTGNQLCNGLI